MLQWEYFTGGLSVKYMNETLVVTTADAKDGHENESEGPLLMLDTERGSIGILCVRRMDMISGPRVPLARISLLLGGCC